MEAFVRRITTHLRAGANFLVISTVEEDRALELLAAAVRRLPIGDGGRWRIRQWEMGTGWLDNQTAKRPEEAFAEIEKESGETGGMYVFKDVIPYMKSDPGFVRRLRSLAHAMADRPVCVVLIQTSSYLPPELMDDAVVEPLALPDEDELRRLLVGLGMKRRGEESDLLVESVKGLTQSQARQAAQFAMVETGGLDKAAVPIVHVEKKRLLTGHEALTYYTPTERSEDIGGLYTFKAWIRRQKVAFTPFGRSLGVPPPRGVLLAGISGTGKSLSAKVCANELGFPLVRLEVGRLFGPLVGDSERITERTLQVVDALSPVLWIDELDKAFAGTSGAQGDSGTSQRVLGQLLSYMQERKSNTFIVATANDISGLPTELTRRGRFSETFFVDIGSAQERDETYRIHIGRYLGERELPKFDTMSLAKLSENFTGAEIEQCVIEGMYEAATYERRVQQSDIVKAIQFTVPLAVSQRERVERLRLWVRDGRLRSAN